MARTLGGNLTGAAAREEARDLAEYNHQKWVQEERARLIDRENALLDEATHLPGFSEFWETVPTFGTHRDRIAMLNSFIATHSPTLP